jgi:hypothetical protein
MHALIHDVRHALRVMGRHPGHTLVAILAPALGIGVAAAIFTSVDLGRPLAWPLHVAAIHPLLLVAVACGLLIAAADVAGLSLERAQLQATVRAADPRRALRSLAPGALLALIGGALGLLVARWAC